MIKIKDKCMLCGKDLQNGEFVIDLHEFGWGGKTGSAHISCLRRKI